MINMCNLNKYGINDPLRFLHIKRQKEFYDMRYKNMTKEKTGQSNGWKTADNGTIVKFENEGDIVKGVFQGIEESKTYKNSWALKFLENEDLKVVFITKMAHDLITTNDIMKGDEFILEYRGKKETEDKKFKYNNYALQYKKN